MQVQGICKKCAKNIKIENLLFDYTKEKVLVVVEPCPRCENSAYDDGWNDSYTAREEKTNEL